LYSSINAMPGTHGAGSADGGSRTLSGPIHFPGMVCFGLLEMPCAGNAMLLRTKSEHD
jgi:hypothetical protein